MYTRRDLLYGGVGGLVSALFPRRSQASCSALVLDIQFEVITEDPVSLEFFTGKSRDLVERLVEPSQKLFARELGIPVTVFSYGPFTGLPKDEKEIITIFYGTKKRFLSAGYPTMEDLYGLLSYSDGDVVEKVREGYEKTPDRAKFENALRAAILLEALKPVSGIADKNRKLVGLFPPDAKEIHEVQTYLPEKDVVDVFTRIIGRTLAHELGHIFGLSHARKRMLKNEKFDVMRQMAAMPIDDYMDMNYDFSKRDQQRIHAAQCSNE